jgi:hypothetical protein
MPLKAVAGAADDTCLAAAHIQEALQLLVQELHLCIKAGVGGELRREEGEHGGVRRESALSL